MHDLTLERDRIKINLKAFVIGEDLCVILSGGDSPHIGTVTLSVPRPSLTHSEFNSSTTSVLNLIGHKDDEVAKYVSHILSSKLNKNVVVTCGIHVDNITIEEINITKYLLKELTDVLIERILI
ncbi:hypothetical protein NNC19_07690 [Clostridium sp. SHJSY1]|uniref:proteasome assembly chaperone 4 family protein n=1 Tax=Clostridium sp. SHJSY1 TaxID=2942483 RepID=UPI002875FDD2|nr:proteasome assembly chaperone 4 family protein [Clostridium sp. SHJSY1]MDS0525555.1 hypothetical protein [Clostridium sp. SHJSY1]